MNFLSLEYFLAVAEELNITKAAERLYITQQSLSNSIIKLEKELGTKLFNRSPGFTLTYAGSKLRNAAVQILGIKTRVLNEIDDISKNRRGEIKIGISHTRGHSVLPRLLPEYKLSHPQVEITLVEGNSELLENKLSHGMIDLLFSSLPIMLDEAETIELVKERMFLVVHKRFSEQIFKENCDFMRGKFSESADITAYKDSPFLLLKEGNRLRTLMNSYFNSNGITPNILLETENIETAFALAVEGMGITVYPEMFLMVSKHQSHEDVDFFPLNSITIPSTLAVAYNNKRYLARASRDLINLAVEKFKR